MEGNKEDQQHSLSNGEFHQQAQPQEEQLGLGLQKQAPSNPIVPDPDPIDRENELNQKLGELSVKDEEEIGSVVLSPEVVEERKLKEAVAGEKVEKVEVEEALVGEAVPVEVEVQSDVKAIEEEIAGDGAVGDEFRDVDLSGLGDANDRGEKDEENDHIGDGKANEEMESETCPVLGEDETDNKELKEADNKELKEGIADNHGSEWGEIENDEWDDGTEKKQAEDKLETVNNYESNWIETENGEDDARKIEDTKEQLIFENYEDERSGEDQYNEEANEYGNVEGESGWKDERNRRFHYPLRPDAEDCAYYMKTGTCKFGSNCKFNHPLRRRNQTSKETFKQKEENQDKLEQTECKYYSTSVGCKYGKACRFNHGRGKAAVAPILEFNFLGLPIRAGEKECPYYMRTGSCKYGSNCRFNHPDPTAVGGGDPFSGHSDSSSQGGLKDTNSGWSSARLLNETAPFMPVMYPPTPAAPPETEWNGYKAPVYPTTESGLPTPPAFAMNIPATDANFYAHHQQRMLIDEFPERPGQPECSYYMKTGNCKYKSGCKFHHPKNRKAKMSSSAFSDQGLPLRPDQNICTHYSRFGICKYGPACKYNHPAMNGNLSSAVGSEPGQPFQYGNSVDAGEEWKRESFMQQSV